MTRSLELDVLRFVAVALVIVRHLSFLQPEAPAWAHPAIEVGVRGGWVGVDLFFVLSGFLVSGLLYREHQRHGAIRFGRFFVRRGFKIYPAYYFLMLVSLAVLAASGRAIPWERFGAEAVFIQNYGEPLWDHTWSLAIEEHFYVALPILLILLSRRARDPFGVIPWLYAVLALGLLALRWQMARTLPYSYPAFLYPTHVRIDSLMCGVAIGYLYHYRGEALRAWVRPKRRALGVLGALCIVPAFVLKMEDTPLVYTLGYSLFQWGFGLILIVVLTGGLPFGASSKLVARIAGWTGAYSYSIYLWHLPVMMAVERARLPWAAAVPLYLAGSIGAGVILGKLIELPTLKLRDRWFPSRGDSPVR